eukprot:scaffold9.g3156.t1
MTLFSRHSNDIRPLGPTKVGARGEVGGGVTAAGPGPCMSPRDQSFDKDRAEVLSRAARTGVVAAVLTGTCVRTSSAAARLAAAAASAAVPGAPGGGSDAAGALGSPQLYFTAGVHPHNAKGCGPGTLDALAALAADPRCVALGEMGLDFNRNFSPQDVQASFLLSFHFLGTGDTRQHRRSVPGVVHCFTSPRRDELEALLAEEGLLVGITGWVCDDRLARGGAELAALLPLIPDDRLLLETDAPYLTPRTITPAKARPQRNEPALLPAVLEAVAAARGQDLAHVAAVATANARRLFCLS